jgi:Holliday junction resolvase RusA-like endonuclease
MTHYDLPLPPSVNALYKNTPHGRAKTNNYLDWITLARSALRKQKARPLFDPVRITYQVSEKSRIDLGNHEKPLTDLLVFHGIIENDSKQFVRGISLEWSSQVEGVRVIIEPATVKQQEAA